MAVDVIMPRVDMTMERGTIRAWKAAPGDAVREGALLFEIETDKSAMEIDAPASGTLGPILVPAGVEVPVGTVVARILAAGEAAEAGVPQVAAAPPPAAPPTPSAAMSATPTPVALPVPAARASSAPAGADPRPRATPLARRLARENGLDLASLRGTGPRGRIGRADVEAARAASAARAAAPGPEAAAAVFHSRIRVDLGELLALRARLAAGRPGHAPPGLTALLLRMLAAVLPGHPALLGDGGRVHVAVAMAGGDGARLAVLADLQGRRADWIAAELARLATAGADAHAPRPALVLANVGRLGIEDHAAAPRRGGPPVLALGLVGRDRHASLVLAADRDALDPLEAMRFLSRLRDFAGTPGLAL